MALLKEIFVYRNCYTNLAKRDCIKLRRAQTQDNPAWRRAHPGPIFVNLIDG